MRKAVLGLLAALALLARAGGVRAAEPTTIVVVLQSFTGAPPDSATRTVFMDAFQQEFDADELPWQKRDGESWSHSGERRNRFRLVDLAAPEAAWGLSLTIGLPPPVLVTRPRQRSSDPAPKPRATEYRASRGLTIVAAVTAPLVGSTGESIEPVKFAVYFPDAKRVVVPSRKLPGGAYAYPWADAGRVVARAALEVLYRSTETLAEDERADLDPAVRTENLP
jgi:hypothetical protein